MEHYELLYIISATYAEDELIPFKEKIKELIGKNGGRITREDNLGRRKLAYPIKKIRQGYYLLVEFDLERQNLKKLEESLHLTTEVLRHLLTKKSVQVIPVKVKTGKFEPTKPLIKKGRVEKEKEKPLGEKVSLEELDKKLDEILEGDII